MGKTNVLADTKSFVFSIVKIEEKWFYVSDGIYMVYQC